MKKITLSIITLATLVFFACEEKKTTTPITTTTTSTTSTTSTTGTTGNTYYVRASYNGTVKEFTNLTVFRDESTADKYLLIVANNLDKENPKIEFNFKEPATGWANNASYSINAETVGSYIKYTNESGRVYSTINTTPEFDPLVVNFTKLQYEKDGIINATMNGILSIDTDTTKVRVTLGTLNLKCEN